jgi:hypothetical protein
MNSHPRVIVLRTEELHYIIKFIRVTPQSLKNKIIFAVSSKRSTQSILLKRLSLLIISVKL